MTPEAQLQNHEARISILEDKQDKLDNLVEALVEVKTEQKNIKEDMTEIKTDVKELLSKDSKTWDALKGKILWLVVGGLIGYLFYILLGVNL